MGKKGPGLGSFFVRVVPIPDEIPATPVQSASPMAGRGGIASAIGQEDQKIKDQLAAALDQANQPGFDYYEFSQAIHAQEALIPAEALRFQSVFNIAKTMGLTIDTLVRTASQYLDVLKKKENEFLTALQSHIDTDITGKEQAVTGIDKQIQDKSEQIRKINEEMNVLQQQKVAMQNEASSSKSEVERIKNNFYATLQVFQNKITTDIQKINQYLKGA